MILDGIGSKGQPTRGVYQRRLPEDPSKDYYFIMRDTGKLQSLLIEYGFIDNINDVRRLENNILKYAEGVVKAVSEYAGITYRPPSSEETSPEVYVVQRGDSLYSIANRFGTTVESLKRLNNLTSDIIQIGQELEIPTEGPMPPENENVIVYIVQPNDSLYKISQRYNVPIETIIEYNRLQTTQIAPGQQLLLPVEGSTGNSQVYVVKVGDSLWKIANSFGVSVDDLINENQLDGTTIQVGQKLVIPKETTTPPPSTTNRYTVRAGDSLWSIASRFNTTVEELKRLNQLTSNTVQIGQVLQLPATGGPTTYTIQAGDSLWAIAQRFNTTVENLRRWNSLSSDLLQIGQQLRVS